MPLLRNYRYGALFFALLMLMAGCAAPAALSPGPSVSPATPAPEASAEQIGIPDFSEACEPCELPEIEPLPEGYTLEADLTAMADAGEGTDGDAQYHKITAREAQAMMEEDGALIVDVRTREEYEAGHISGALLIPNETIASEQPALLPDTSATLLIYCRSGNRSRQAALKLLELGYTRVYDFGGIIDWPYEIITGADA